MLGGGGSKSGERNAKAYYFFRVFPVILFVGDFYTKNTGKGGQTPHERLKSSAVMLLKVNWTGMRRGFGGPGDDLEDSTCESGQM